MMNNKRILVLANDWGGLHSFRKEVFLAFREQGYDVHICCPTSKTVAKSQWFVDIGCKVIEIKFNRHGMNPLADIKLVLKYKTIIRQVQPFVVFTYTIKPNVYGGMACALCGIPQIANITGLGTAVEYPGLLQKLTIMLYKVGMRKTYLTFFQNDENRQFCLKHGMVNRNTKLIPGSGVNISFHEQKPYPDETEPIRFIFCSRIRKEKGIEEYIAAAEAMHEKYAGKVEFHVLGGCEGDYEAKLKDLTDKGILTYYGRQADVRPFFAMGNCTIHPTFYPEGMSNVLLESCATGRPIITTNRAGCREVVDEGINGFIVKQHDSADLIEKVERFIKLPYEQKKQMGGAAREKVEREFDRQIVVNAYLTVVNEIL